MALFKAAFVGTGMIGAGLAACAAVRDFDVMLYDIADEATVRSRYFSILDTLYESGAASLESVEAAKANFKYTTNLEKAVTGADFVQECIPERIELKQATYRTIQTYTGPNTIIASSTSTLFPTNLQEGAIYPETILVGHPYNPSYILPLIEICGGEQTSKENIERAKTIYTAMGKAPIVCRKEVDGFIVNRISIGIMESARELIDQGICSLEDIDRALMFGPGMRLAITGQMLTFSLGVDGGFRAIAKKYGKEPTPNDEYYAQEIDSEIANRDPAIGNTVDSVCKFRDHAFAEILKLQKML